MVYFNIGPITGVRGPDVWSNANTGARVSNGAKDNSFCCHASDNKWVNDCLPSIANKDTGPPVRDFDCGGQTLALGILAVTNFAYFQAFW